MQAFTPIRPPALRGRETGGRVEEVGGEEDRGREGWRREECVCLGRQEGKEQG